MRYENVSTEELEAERLTEYLVKEYPPSVLEKVIQKLDKALRRLTIAKLLADK